MAKLIHLTVEPNEENTDGLAVTVYFDGKPTKKEVLDSLDTADIPCGQGGDNYEYAEYPNVLSERAKLRRYQCFPNP